MSTQLAETMIGLLKDLMHGRLTDEWAAVSKAAIAEPILALSRLSESLRTPSECLRTPTLWLTLAALCVINDEHVEKLSSGRWMSMGGVGLMGSIVKVGGEAYPAQAGCENHDDGDTLAVILCTDCGNLCAECDRVLHLHRRTRQHTRQVATALRLVRK